MARYALCVEYDGSHFKGWQIQKQQRTVQQEVELAISKVADHDVGVITAGRTDTAVHATGQIIHFDTVAKRDHAAWLLGVNRFLPADVRIQWATEVADSFHARFSARRRSYRYVIYNHNVKPGLLRNYATFQYQPLDVLLMREAAAHFIGKRDFSSIRAAGCQAKSPTREIFELDLYSHGRWIWFDITANAFLQHMVRNIAGMLMAVGAGERSPAWVAEVLGECDRTKAGVTALPSGLYLASVEYDAEHSLPDRPEMISFWGDTLAEETK